ncbi:unnamed protein product [Phytomonas sp. EM1]|nr:unnamed protein product [Phytomonas sp. EM1]|eukprot:CCW63663.1 unnamed protein product [Phytomonas sp. isolate EM1]
MLASHKKHLHLAPGDVVNGKYEVIDEVGCGNFAKVYRCYVLHNSGIPNCSSAILPFNQGSAFMSGPDKSKSTTNQHYDNGNLLPERTVVAMKVIKREDKISAVFERRMLRILNERDKNRKARVSRMYEYFEWKNFPVFIMPLHGSSLRSLWLGTSRVSVSRLMVLEFAYDILETLSFIHFDCRMVHTDLKPENILLEDAHASQSSRKHKWVICDFGSSSLWRRDSLDSDLISTRPYRAPEVILGNKWHYAADMWSLGCIIYEVAVGHRLFEVNNDNTHLQVMEKRLGKLPDLFTRRSRNSSKFFTSKGNFAHISDSIQSKQRPIASIKAMFQKDVTFLELLSSLLTYDPSKRITAPYALWLPVFDPIRNKKQKPTTGGTNKASYHQPADDAARGAADSSNPMHSTRGADATHTPPDSLAASGPCLSQNPNDPPHAGMRQPTSTLPPEAHNVSRESRGQFSIERSGVVETQPSSFASTPCDATLKRLNTSTVHSTGLTSSWKSDGELYRRNSSMGTVPFMSGGNISIAKPSPGVCKHTTTSIELSPVKSKTKRDVRKESEAKGESLIDLNSWASKVEDFCSKSKTHSLSASKVKDPSNRRQKRSISICDARDSPKRQQLSGQPHGCNLASNITHRGNCSIAHNTETQSLAGQIQDISNKNTTTNQQETQIPPSSHQLASENEGKHSLSGSLKEDGRRCASHSKKTAQNALRSFSTPPPENLPRPFPVAHPTDSAPSKPKIASAASHKTHARAATYSSAHLSSLTACEGKDSASPFDLSSRCAGGNSHPQEEGRVKPRKMQGAAAAVTNTGVPLTSGVSTNRGPPKSSTVMPRGRGGEETLSKDIGSAAGEQGSLDAVSTLIPSLNGCKGKIKVQKGSVGSNVTLLVRKRVEPHKEQQLQPTSLSGSSRPVVALRKQSGDVVSVPQALRARVGDTDGPSPCGTSSNPQFDKGCPPRHKCDQRLAFRSGIPVAVPSITELTGKSLKTKHEYVKEGHSRGNGSEGVGKAYETPTDFIKRCHTSPTLHQQDSLTNSGISTSLSSPLGGSMEYSEHCASGTQVEPAVEILKAQACSKTGTHQHSATVVEAREAGSKFRNRTMSLCMMSSSMFMTEITKDLAYTPRTRSAIQLKALCGAPISPKCGTVNPITKEQAVMSACSKGDTQESQNCAEEMFNSDMSSKMCTEGGNSVVAARRTSCAPSSLLLSRRSTMSKGGTTFHQTLTKVSEYENSQIQPNLESSKRYFAQKDNAFNYQHTIYANKKIRDNVTSLVAPVSNGTC